MQDPSTKIEEAVKAKTTGITEPVNEQAVVKYLQQLMS